jgi:hypothetical protein
VRVLLPHLRSSPQRRVSERISNQHVRVRVRLQGTDVFSCGVARQAIAVAYDGGKERWLLLRIDQFYQPGQASRLLASKPSNLKKGSSQGGGMNIMMEEGGLLIESYSVKDVWLVEKLKYLKSVECFEDMTAMYDLALDQSAEMKQVGVMCGSLALQTFECI